VQPGFYGSNGNFEHLSNLFIGGILQIAQNNDRRVILRETVEGALHTLLGFPVLGCFFRVSESITIPDQFRAVQRHVALMSQLQVFAAGARVIECDAIEPGGKIRVAAKLMNRLKSGEKHLLSYLRGLLIVSQETINETKRRLLVPPHQDFEGISVTPLDSLDAFRIAYTLNKHRLRLY